MELRYTSNRSYFLYNKPAKVLCWIAVFFFCVALVTLFFASAICLSCVIFGVSFYLLGEELGVHEEVLEEQTLAESERLGVELEERYWDVARPFPRMVVKVIGDYETEGEGVLVRRSKTLGRFISSRYHVAAIGLKDQRLYYSERDFSLIEENKCIERGGERDFTDLDRADYGSVEDAAIPHSEFALFGRDGEEILRVPAQSDYSIQRYTDDLNAVLAHAREKRNDDHAGEA